MSLLDFFFPKYCVWCKTLGSYLCTSCFTRVSFLDAGFCALCQRPAIGGFTHPVCKKTISIDGVFSSLVYGGVVKKLVYQFKYRPYLRDLQDTLSDFFYEGLIQKEGFYRIVAEEVVFVPIPLHKAKLKKRGYNQSYLLAERLAKKFSKEVWDALERVKSTPTQVGLSKEKRAENIKDAFRVKKEFVERLKTVKQVLLVDDVVTSGATLKEAAGILKKNGVGKVWGVTLAHGK